MADISESQPSGQAQLPPRRRFPRPRFSLAALFGVMTVCGLGAWYWYQVPFVVEGVYPAQYFDENGRYVGDGSSPAVDPFGSSVPASKGREVAYVRRVWSRDRDTVRHGPWTLFDGRGKVHSTGHYRNDARHGTFVEHYASGARLKEEHYERGVLHGPSRRWNEAGMLVSEVHYSRGQRHGRFFQAHRDGRPAIEGNYHNGSPEGPWVWRPAFGANDDVQFGTLNGDWNAGVPDGVWTLRDPDGTEVLTIRLADRRLVEAEPEVDFHLATMLARGDIEPERITTLFRGADCSFPGRRLARVVELLRLKYETQIHVTGAAARTRAKGSSPPLADVPVTYEQNRVPLIVVLGEIGRPLGLVGDYRYGKWWITTPEQAKDADPTGVEAIVPPQRSRLASAWENRVDLEFVDMPVGDTFAFLALQAEVRIDTSRLQPSQINMPLTVTTRNTCLKQAVGCVLLASGCRASLEGETIVIEPLEEQ